MIGLADESIISYADKSMIGCTDDESMINCADESMIWLCYDP